MNIRFLLVIASLLIIRCGNQSSNQHEHGENDADSTRMNQVLYDQVMEIHDEVMPKMQDLYTLKKGLQDKIAATPNLSEEEKQMLEKRIVVLDSVSQLMMDWMHNFTPMPDSMDQEAAREYLESEIEKIRKVREAMLEAIASEKGSI